MSFLKNRVTGERRSSLSPRSQKDEDPNGHPLLLPSHTPVTEDPTGHPLAPSSPPSVFRSTANPAPVSRSFSSSSPSHPVMLASPRSVSVSRLPPEEKRSFSPLSSSVLPLGKQSGRESAYERERRNEYQGDGCTHSEEGSELDRYVPPSPNLPPHAIFPSSSSPHNSSISLPHSREKETDRDVRKEGRQESDRTVRQREDRMYDHPSVSLPAPPQPTSASLPSFSLLPVPPPSSSFPLPPSQDRKAKKETKETEETRERISGGRMPSVCSSSASPSS
uniref:Uncharacterized protein n=1 Tax=Chromera velia CCMP2878 TaxID=1169474 RepID=A0A0G4FZK8_9ALVE|eukprot:Cvel_19468.t1-p1 / transcript=Cvel_19468.t1 / gene=Cvel_19468 / organism=Chromera_velia_CCMP2878 / gene_product=hypothetical protein / transcript_product=hypothetical protein / location=Cvel_scaffold1680:38682-39596(+) / protein_length=277 / sequence_SO=supercontig / SO=protein_coding / is_pseudo=false